MSQKRDSSTAGGNKGVVTLGYNMRICIYLTVAGTLGYCYFNEIISLANLHNSNLFKHQGTSWDEH